MNYLPWQEESVARIGRALAEQRLGHAWLLHGPAGVGKTFLAAELAAALVQGPAAWSPGAPGGEPHWDAAAGELRPWPPAHPDVHWLRPEEGKRTISVDQVRAAIAALTLHSHAGGARVLVVAPAEALTMNAANSLLKTLEEPPGASYVLLVAHEAGRLPATVRSRCQQLRCPAPPPQLAGSWLQGQRPDGTRAAALLGLADGAPLAALRWHTQGLAAAGAQWEGALLGVLTGAAAATPLVSDWHQRLEGALVWLEHVLRGMARSAAGAESGTDCSAGLAALAERTGPTALMDLWLRVLQIRRWSEGGVNVELQLETLLASWTAAVG